MENNCFNSQSFGRICHDLELTCKHGKGYEKDSSGVHWTWTESFYDFSGLHAEALRAEPEKIPMKVSGITAHLGWHHPLLQSVVFSATVLNSAESRSCITQFMTTTTSHHVCDLVVGGEKRSNLNVSFLCQKKPESKRLVCLSVCFNRQSQSILCCTKPY